MIAIGDLLGVVRCGGHRRNSRPIEVGQTVCQSSLLPRLGQCRQENCDQYGDDRNDDQQLDERERPAEIEFLR